MSSSISSSPERENQRRFENLRGVQWRIDLGILPNSTNFHDLRRVTADFRRRYAALRRRLLVDTHILKDGSDSPPDLVMDNPLSQNPDSMWGRFFRGAELERMLDQDLSRLYPEHGSYFQTAACQSLLRRILLLWCLRHPEYGYRQGMHELLAPLLYVLHADVQSLSELRKLYKDHFTDKFDGFSFYESDLTYKFDFKKFTESTEDEVGAKQSPVKANSLKELDPNIQSIVSLSDAYGAEGELGIVLSEKFMEHDAYCMFDALMSGSGGGVAMAEFFSPSPIGGPLNNGIPPVIEASSALYHLLSVVDSSLYSHLVELGVEPQYFALRWFRVLFGREFALEDLLIVWDEIFSHDNTKLNKSAENDVGSSFGVLSSRRGGFISAFAVSMILHLRSAVLATENATSCLQRLLNFPENINLDKLITKAKSLQALAMDSNDSAPHSVIKSVVPRTHSLSLDSLTPINPRSLVPESYWEEKWRVIHKEEERKKGSSVKQTPSRIKGWSDKVKMRLSRTESAPSKVNGGKRDHPRPPVRRNLLQDLARQLGSEEEEIEEIVCNEDLGQKVPDLTVEERCLSGNGGSEENSSICSESPSPVGGTDNNCENESERSSVASNLSVDEIEIEIEENIAEPCNSNEENVDPTEEASIKSVPVDDSMGKSATNLKEKKILLGKFQWFWKFGKNGVEGTSEKGGVSNSGNNQIHAVSSSTADGLICGSSVSSKGDVVDQNMMVNLRSLGQSMLDNIQVIESVLQQERGQVAPLENSSKNVLVGRGQVTAMAALKELRKISNLLSEM